MQIFQWSVTSSTIHSSNGLQWRFRVLLYVSYPCGFLVRPSVVEPRLTESHQRLLVKQTPLTSPSQPNAFHSRLPLDSSSKAVLYEASFLLFLARFCARTRRVASSRPVRLHRFLSVSPVCFSARIRRFGLLYFYKIRSQLWCEFRKSAAPAATGLISHSSLFHSYVPGVLQRLCLRSVNLC